MDDKQIWDGNGGTLDPQKAPTRDLLVALHYKFDAFRQDYYAFKADHEDRVRTLESRMYRALGGVTVIGVIVGIFAH